MPYKQYPGDINEYIRTTDPGKIDLDYIVDSVTAHPVTYVYTTDKEYTHTLVSTDIYVDDAITDLPNEIVKLIITTYKPDNPQSVSMIQNSTDFFYAAGHSIDDSIAAIDGKIIYLHEQVNRRSFDGLLQGIIDKYNPSLIIGTNNHANAQGNSIFYISQEFLDNNSKVSSNSLIYILDDLTHIFMLVPGIEKLNPTMLQGFIDTYKPTAITAYSTYSWMLEAKFLYTDMSKIIHQDKIIRLKRKFASPAIVNEVATTYKPDVIVAHRHLVLYANPDHINDYIESYDYNSDTLVVTIPEVSVEFLPQLVEKYPYVQKILYKGGVIWDNQRKTTAVTVNRGTVLKDYLHILINNDLWGSRCNFQFTEEAGVDAGGLTNEVFNLISIQLKNDFFVCKESRSAGCYYMFSPTKENCSKKLALGPNCYKYIGQLVAKSIKEGYIINISFSHTILALLAGLVTEYNLKSLLEYLQYDDSTYVSSLTSAEGKKNILENADLFETASGLIPTAYNYDKFLEETITDRLGVNMLDKSTYSDFIEGAHSIIPASFSGVTNDRLRQRDEDPAAFMEFQRQVFEKLSSLLIGKFSLHLWKARTIMEYKEERLNVNNMDPLPAIERINDAKAVYNWFWEIVEESDENTQKKILVYQSGLPYVKPDYTYVIFINDASAENLPSAHTCSYQLDLSINYTKEKLRDKLMQAIIYGMSFEILGGSANNNYRDKYLKYKRKYLEKKRIMQL